MELDTRSERSASRCGTALPSPAGSMHSRRSRAKSRSRRAMHFTTADEAVLRLAPETSANSSMSIVSGPSMGPSSPGDCLLQLLGKLLPSEESSSREQHTVHRIKILFQNTKPKALILLQPPKSESSHHHADASIPLFIDAKDSFGDF